MNTTIQHAEPLSVGVTITRVDDQLTFAFSASPLFRNQLDMYNHLRTALSQFLDGAFITVRFAAQQRYADARLLTCPRLRELYHDPLVMLRDPVRHANMNLTITLQALPFSPSYIRAKNLFLVPPNELPEEGNEE